MSTRRHRRGRGDARDPGGYPSAVTLSDTAPAYGSGRSANYGPSCVLGTETGIRVRPTQALQLAILRAELAQLSAWTGGAVWRQVLCLCALTQIHAEADRVEEALDARRRSPRGPRGLLRARDPPHPGDRLVSASCAGGAQVPGERAEDFQSWTRVREPGTQSPNLTVPGSVW